MQVARSRRFTFGLALILTLSLVRAANACDAPSLQRQSPDAATIVRLENAWSLAYLRGDPDFETCLLTSDFMERPAGRRDSHLIHVGAPRPFSGKPWK